jgi:mannose-6-phosphate isomerase-like protein (cupin superfamily)
MFVRELKKSQRFVSGDRAILRELLNPNREPLDLRFSLAHAVVLPGKRTRPHRLKTSEVYYMLAGRGVMHIDAESKTVRVGQAVYIPPGAVQFIENSGRSELRFLCIVDPAWRPEDEEILG